MEKLTNEQLSLLPTQEEMEKFNRRGWYISKSIFSESEIEQALLGVQRHYKGERDTPLPKKISLTYNSSNTFRYDTLVVQQNHQIASLTNNPLIGYIASLLMKSREVRLFFSAIAKKTPQQDEHRFNVGWHTDTAYYRTCASENMLTAWIPLHDCDETMGTLTFLEGSHLKENSNVHIEQLKQARKFFSNDSDFSELKKLLDESNHSMNISTTRLRKGQCCFLNSNVLHYTGPNISNKSRIAIVLSFQAQENHYRKIYDDHGVLISCDVDNFCMRLSNGDPDYTDPKFFPVLCSR